MRAAVRRQRHRASAPGDLLYERSGTILIVVLLLLSILTMLVAGMSRRTRTDSALAGYTAGAIRAKYIAWSGVRYVGALIAQDTADPESSRYDTLTQCGFFRPNGRTDAELFRQVPVSGGYFDIVPSWQFTGYPLEYGLSDEDGRLNLNAINAGNYRVLKFLIMDRGYDEECAETIASSLVDWIDADEEVFNPPYGHEDGAGTAAVGPAVKNLPLQSVRELMLLQGMTPGIFHAVCPYVTVCAARGAMAFNYNTAAAPVLRSLARVFTGPATKTVPGDADALVDKIVRYRSGPDGREGTADDRPVDVAALPVNMREKSILLSMLMYLRPASEFLRFGVRGNDARTHAAYRAEVIYSRRERNIVYWHKM